MKKRQRAARGGELVQKQDRGSGGSYSGSLHSAPWRSGSAKVPVRRSGSTRSQGAGPGTSVAGRGARARRGIRDSENGAGAPKLGIEPKGTCGQANGIMLG